MLAGELNKRISLSHYVTERDDLGSEKVVSKKWLRYGPKPNRCRIVKFAPLTKIR